MDPLGSVVMRAEVADALVLALPLPLDADRDGGALPPRMMVSPAPGREMMTAGTVDKVPSGKMMGRPVGLTTPTGRAPDWLDDATGDARTLDVGVDPAVDVSVTVTTTTASSVGSPSMA
jgi:hypothetical protein